jgi:phosphate transport system substrate-binding protein
MSYGQSFGVASSGLQRVGMVCGLAALLMMALPASIARADTAADLEDVIITGAGSSFAAPLYGGWSTAAQKAVGVRVNYQAIGSGAGQNLVSVGTVDFGASDAPMAHERLVSAGLLQVPTAIGGIVVTANVPGVPAGSLRLTGPVLADIYAGRITQWDDAQLVALNPGVTLPDLPIAPLHRADGSGTTYVFTDYLSRVSHAWQDSIGRGMSVAWPTGAGARGNDGIAAYVRNTEGSIGYVEYAYAARNNLTGVQLRNQAGNFVPPTVESFSHAAESAHWDDADMTATLCDAPGEESWPIVTTTYVLLPAHATEDNKGEAVRRFFRRAVQEGGSIGRALDYVPLPPQVAGAVVQRLERH